LSQEYYGSFSPSDEPDTEHGLLDVVFSESVDALPAVLDLLCSEDEAVWRGVLKMQKRHYPPPSPSVTLPPLLSSVNVAEESGSQTAHSAPQVEDKV
jgi:hypothetical protein